MGRTMREWCRFTVCYWHTFRGTGADPFGAQTLFRPWEDGTDSVDNAIRRARVAFEFFQKLGVDFYSFHDRDVAPEGKTLKESNQNLDRVVDVLESLQKETGISLLWGTQNLFANPRYMNGAASSPDAHIFAYAAAQTKKIMEVTHRLGGKNLVFWGGREGYQSILNTDVKRELDHLARFFHMVSACQTQRTDFLSFLCVSSFSLSLCSFSNLLLFSFPNLSCSIFSLQVVAYKKKLGATYQLLIEPKPREPMKHQYDYDAQTVIGFLRTYRLEEHFKLNIEPNHTTLAGHDYEVYLLYSCLIFLLLCFSFVSFLSHLFFFFFCDCYLSTIC